MIGMREDEAVSEIVNLKDARKRKARAEQAGRAAENRVRFGRTGAEKRRDRPAEAAREALLDGKRREDAPEKR